MREKIETQNQKWGTKDTLAVSGAVGFFALLGCAVVWESGKEEREAPQSIEYASRLIAECAPEIASEPAVDVTSNEDPAVNHAYVVGIVIDRQLSEGDEPIHDFSLEELARSSRVLRDRLILERRLDSDNAYGTREYLDGVNGELAESCPIKEKSK
jgi:hypothetical protein